MADNSEYELAPHSTEEPSSQNEEPVVAPPPRPSPPKPLPRLHRSAPLTNAEAKAQEEAEEAETGRPRRSRRRAHAVEPNHADDIDGDKKPMEPTPTLDTYEARQKVRLVLGMVAASAVVLAIIMVVRAVGGGPSEEVIILDEAELFPPPIVQNRMQEAEARALLRHARLTHDDRIAQAQLRRILEYYPNTAAAAEAKAALARAEQGEPLFVANTGQTPPGQTASAVPPDTIAVDDPSVAYAPRYEPPAPVPPRDVPPTQAARAVDTPRDFAPAPPPRLPVGFQPKEGTEVHASGWPLEIVCERDESTLMLIPADVYWIGRNDGTVAESPAIQVRMPTFYIDRHEVTVGQYEQFREAMAQRGESIYPRPEDVENVAPTPDHPIVLVTAREALAYARWAGKALPSAAQWEVAARGPSNRVRPWGIGQPEWSKPRAPKQLDPVMSFPLDVSPFGVADMAGNAWEWTADWYDSRYYENFRGQVVENPAGPRESKSRPPQLTIKGSSRTWESSYREGMRVDTRLPYLGFRCVLSVGGEPQIQDRTPPAPAPTARPSAPAPTPGGQPAIGEGSLVPF